MNISPNRLSWSKMPYRRMPPVVSAIGRPQPRMTTHSTAMFHGPRGMLAPIPVRIRYDWSPRSRPRPGMRAVKIAPVRTHAMSPKTASMRKSWSVSPWSDAMTSW